MRPLTSSPVGSITRHRGVARLLVAACLLAAAPPALLPFAPASEPSATSRRDELVSVVDRVKGAVVNIHSERTVAGSGEDPFRPSLTTQPQRINGMGTGIVLDPRGYVVTNYHVVDDVQSLRVHLADGTRLSARVLASDKESDLAIIKIDPGRALPTAALGTAADLMLAEQVIAIGNAYGYEHTVTIGHVSAMKRDVTLNKEVAYKSLIQTQTPINPGNSGGPLFNKLGEVVGVNVAIRAGAQNIAFAIPVDAMILKAAEMLSVRRRLGLRHGLTVADRHERKADDSPVQRWVSVTAVEAGSPAAEAGIKAGDVLEKLGDLAVQTSIDVERALFERTGKPLTVALKRDGSAKPVEVSLALKPPTPVPSGPAEVVWTKLGLQLTAVGPTAVTQADRQLRGGLSIQDVASGSLAAKAGLQKGDVLIGLHQWESINLDNVLFVLNHKDYESFAPLKAFYIREGRVREAQLTGSE